MMKVFFIVLFPNKHIFLVKTFLNNPQKNFEWFGYCKLVKK